MEPNNSRRNRLARPGFKSLTTILLIAVLALFAVLGCHKKKEDNTLRDFFILNMLLNSGSFLVDAFKNTAPEITATTSAVQSRFLPNAALSTGQPTWWIFQILRKYTPVVDDGKIDSHNMYKALQWTNDLWSAASGNCTKITAKVVASPFNFGRSDTYDCVFTRGDMSSTTAQSAAITKGGNGQPYKFLLTYMDMRTPTSVKSYIVIQGTFNDSTSAVDVDMVELVLYPPGSQMAVQAGKSGTGTGFGLRMNLVGNAGTGQFTIKQVTNLATDTTGAYTSFVGTGISHRAGQYFLLKGTHAPEGGGGSANRYYCVPSLATEANLEALPATGSGTVDSSCTGYQTAVDALTIWDDAATPRQLSNFTGSSILLSY